MSSSIDRVFSRALHHATNGKVTTPRPQQVSMVEWIEQTMSQHSHLAVEAPVGTGKSLSYLVPAFVRAGEARRKGRQERTVIITQGLGLQRQLVDDSKNVIAAINDVLDISTDVAVLKGFDNYVCRETALTHAKVLLGTSAPADRYDVVEALRAEADPSLTETATIEGHDYDLARVQQLLIWALENDEPLDKDSCPVDIDKSYWSLVSTPKDKCTAIKCPLFEICAPFAADERAAEADVVITNQTLGAIQAAQGVATVINRSGLGEFEHVIVDEAHALPNEVRARGKVTLGAPRILRLVERVRDEIRRYSQKARVEAVCASLEELGKHMDWEIQQILQDNNVRAEEKFSLDRDSAYEMLPWVEAIVTELGRLRDVLPKDSDSETLSDIRKSRSRLVADLKQVASHRSGCARWVCMERSGPLTRMTISFSPVQVSFALRDSVWTKAESPELGGQRQAMSVIAVSGTLPPSFPEEAGLSCEVKEVTTPYAQAYTASALYIPTLTDPEREFLRNKRSGRLSMDVGAHKDWAASKIEQLVEANQGSAMVICATIAAGTSYAAKLRSTPRGYNVYTQWDGSSPAQAIARWKADTSSVIVGVRTLMTGIDAPGETNSLVIIDRPSRSPQNPVDDARVRQLMFSQGLNEWDARAMIYDQDAAVLLEQAAGRLIRSASDSGMVAILDPRLADERMTYSALTKAILTQSLQGYGGLTHNLNVATKWLQQRQSALAA